MLPINLLPNYIFDKNKKRNMALVYVGVLAAIAIVLLMKMGSVSKELADAKADLDDATSKQTKYTTVDGNIKKVQNDIAELKTKQTFIANAQTYNSAWPATFELARNLTASNILLKSMSIDTDHKTLLLSAFAPGDANTAEFAIANWVKALEKNSAIVEQVNFKTPPHPFTGTAPATNGAGAAGGGLGMPGSGGPMGMGGMRGPKGMAGGPGGPMGMGGMMMPGSGGFGGAASGAGGSDAVGYAEIEGRPGINFNMSIRLKKALAEGILAPGPAWTPGGGNAAPATGGAPVGPPALGAPSVPGARD